MNAWKLAMVCRLSPHDFYYPDDPRLADVALFETISHVLEFYFQPWFMRQLEWMQRRDAIFESFRYAPLVKEGKSAYVPIRDIKS